MATERSRFRTVILCDDVRSEVGNKKSLMGVYSGDIVAANIPANLALALYVELTIKPNVVEELQIKIWNNDDEVATADIRVEAPTDVGNIILNRNVIGFAKEGFLRITAALNGGKPKEILRKKLSKRAVEPAILSSGPTLPSSQSPPGVS